MHWNVPLGVHTHRGQQQLPRTAVVPHVIR